MKNLTKIVAIFVIVFSVASPSAFAATATSGPYTVSASVDGSLSLSVALRKNTSTGPIVSSMDFGKLVEFSSTDPIDPTKVYKALRSSATSTTTTGNVTAMVNANSHGLPYTITQTGTALASGADSIPAGACSVITAYSTLDNGGAAEVGTRSLASGGSWVGTKTLYTSDGLGSIRTFQAIYSITDDPAAGATTAVPINQKGGTYSGTVTFTVTA